MPRLRKDMREGIRKKLRERVDSKEWEGWADKRRSLWLEVAIDPNAYYHCYTPPGEVKNESNWTEQEDRLLQESLRTHPPFGLWGLFSMNMIGRCGKDCEDRVKVLRSQGKMDLEAVAEHLLRPKSTRLPSKKKKKDNGDKASPPLKRKKKTSPSRGTPPKVKQCPATRPSPRNVSSTPRGGHDSSSRFSTPTAGRSTRRSLSTTRATSSRLRGAEKTTPSTKSSTFERIPGPLRRLLGGNRPTKRGRSRADLSTPESRKRGTLPSYTPETRVRQNRAAPSRKMSKSIGRTKTKRAGRGVVGGAEEIAVIDEKGWHYEVATCSAEHVGPWDGDWERCRLVRTIGSLCHIICKIDGKEIYVPQRFVRRHSRGKVSATKKLSPSTTSSTLLVISEDVARQRLRDALEELRRKHRMELNRLDTIVEEERALHESSRRFDPQDKHEEEEARPPLSILRWACANIRKSALHHDQASHIKTAFSSSVGPRKKTRQLSKSAATRHGSGAISKYTISKRYEIMRSEMLSRHKIERAGIVANACVEMSLSSGVDEFSRTWQASTLAGISGRRP